MEAANQDKVDVAEAKLKGEIGAKKNVGFTYQSAAKIEEETKIMATQRQGEVTKEEIKVKTEVKIFENQKEADVTEANAELSTKKAWWGQLAMTAEVEMGKVVAIREDELQQEVEKKRALAEIEKPKDEHFNKARVEYEAKLLRNNS